jgi:glycosyltransferase involved in cell wall biosynthesis
MLPGDLSASARAAGGRAADLKISVITAVRNAADCVALTLDSVRGQSVSAVEHIVIDGASSDGTLEVIRRRGGHVAQLVSEPDSGIYDAFNKGVSLASGEVVGFLNAGDTYVSSDVLAFVQDCMSSPELDAVYGDVVIVDPADSLRVLRHYRSEDFRPARLAQGFMPAHPALFVRRRVYERIGGFDPGFQQAGDFEFCLRAFLVHGISYRYVPEALVRMRSGGVTNRGLRSKLINTREMLQACRRHGIVTSYLRLSLRLPVKALEMLALRRGRRSR